MTNQPPNVLCIITDQQRADHLSCSGNPVLRTPNMDRIAQEGVRFSRAYVNCPLCMPSRATLFTGETPRGHRVRTNGIPLDPCIPTMPQALADAGYRTHSVGKLHMRCYQNVRGLSLEQHDPNVHAENSGLWMNGQISRLPQPYYGLQTAEFTGGHGHGVFGDYLNWLRREHPGAVALASKACARVPPTGADQSWKSALPAELHHSTWVADRTIAFLQEAAQRDQPFFLWCSFPDPHHPYCPPAPYDSMYAPEDVPPPTRRPGELDDLAPFFRQIYERDVQVSGRGAATRMSDEHMREIIAHTYGMVALIDENVGRILDTVDEAGLRENTIVMFMSDHGDMLGDHWLLNKGPFHFEGLLRVPFMWRWPGHFREHTTVDTPVSLLDFAPTVLDLCGVPVPEGAVPPEPEAPQMLAPWPGRSLAPQLMQAEAAGRDAVLIENDEDYLGLRLRTIVTDRYKLTVYAGQPFGELFDLQDDPGELWNRYHDPEYRAVREELRARLLDELVLTDSRLPRRQSHA